MVRVAVNGFGRIGRLAFRRGFGLPGLDFVLINEHPAKLKTVAYLLKYDSAHGTWHDHDVKQHQDGDAIVVDGQRVAVTNSQTIEGIPLEAHKIDLVLDCTGVFLTEAALAPYFTKGVKKVLVSAPVKEASALNIVVGCNDHDYDASKHRIVTAASCTTNSLAPVVKVMLENFGIKHGVITTIHNITNTQPVVDAPMGKKDDLRRCRSAMMNLSPTSTGSATAISLIYPQLKGKLHGLAVRVPLQNASLTDCVFEVERPTTVEEVNEAMKKAAADGRLKGILGYEEEPLVSTDYINDPRSGIVDALSTLVVDGTLVKLYVWYDNEWGYSCRMIDIAKKMADSMQGAC
eukprot:jgi/Chlat1/2470/Chrsp175S02418